MRLTLGHHFLSPLSRLALCATMLLLASSCSLFAPKFEAPVEPMTAPPVGAHELAGAIAPYAPEPHALNIKLSAVVQGGGVRGKQKLTLYALWDGPQRLKFKAVGSAFVGGLFQIVRNGDQTSIHLEKEGRFFRGSVAQLEQRPDVLLGFQPGDLVRALLVETEARDSLLALPGGTRAPLAPDSSDHYQVAEPIRDARREVYRIRRADGLVDRVTAFDALGRLRVTALYWQYERFDGALYPSRFEITFHDTGLHLRAEVQRLRIDPKLRPQAFSLDAPRGLEARPLSEWLASIPRRPVRIER